jgi:hypothetical protein
MEFRKHFFGTVEHPAPVMWSWQLELVGFSRQQIADLNRVKELYQQGSITSSHLSKGDWSLCAGFTSRIACKARTRVRGKTKMEWNLFCHPSPRR